MLTEIDRKIIRELQKDGRKGFSDLSKILGLNISTLRRKLNALLDEGVIKITAIPDPNKVGFGIVVTIYLKVAGSEIEHVLQELCQDRCNHMVGSTTGSHDIFTWSLFKDTNELSDYLKNRVRMIPGIIGTETMLMLSMNKRTYGWIDLDEEKDSSDYKVKRKSISKTLKEKK